MKAAARARFPRLAALAVLLPGCVYPPVLQSSYQFERHPGMAMEVWWQYGADGIGTMVTTLFNRGTVPKCAWTDALDSRRLSPGESWQVSQGGSPGSIVVTNPMPWDPNCVNAKRDHAAQPQAQPQSQPLPPTQPQAAPR